jgi:hypothetical protein
MTSNDALVAALGLDAVAAVRGYRLQVISEAARRGLRLVTVSPSELVLASPDAHLVIDPIEIRLTILPSPGWDDLAGRMLSWNPAHGWAVCPSTARPPFAYYARAGNRPIDLVPTPALVLDWAMSGFPGRAVSPAGIELDSDPVAIQRLLGFVDPKYRTFLNEAFAHCAPVQIRARLLHRSPLTDGGLIRSDLIVDLGSAPRTSPAS